MDACIAPFMLAAAPAAPPANDRYGEVMVGGLRTAYVSREGLAALNRAKV